MGYKKGDGRIQIGFMPLALESYWDSFPDRKIKAESFAKELTEYLSQFGEICQTGKLIDSPERSHEARLHFQAMDVDVIILVEVTYSTPDDILLDIKKFPRPIILWNTQPTETVHQTMNFDEWMINHGITGVPGVTNLMSRDKIPYWLISGHYREEHVKETFTRILKAIEVTKRIWGSRIGIIGHLYPGMMDFNYDPTMMLLKFGVSTVNVRDQEVLAAYSAVDEKGIQSLSKELHHKYTVSGEFRDKEFYNSVRLALAMMHIVKEKRLDAVSIYCQSVFKNPEIGVTSCLGNSLLLQEGVHVTCEGDVPSALAGMILYEYAGNSLFSEIWSNDFGQDQMLMGHSGQMNLAFFKDDTKSVTLRRHPWWEGRCGRGISLELKMPPGEMTMVTISPIAEGKWRMVASVGQVLDRDPIPLGAPNFWYKMKKPLPQFLDEWMHAGAAHHVAMAYGDWIDDLGRLAEIMGIEYEYI